MSVTSRPRRNRRDGLVRRAGWLSASVLLAVAALAPASVDAANPQPQDNACNNIENGGRSPDYVWTTVDSAGVTAHWATDAAHFDAAQNPTVVVRVCIFDADGTDQGGIDQNTENDGIQLFGWSLLGYPSNPCPDEELTFGSSVDSPAVQTKKSNFLDCGDDEPTTKPSTAPSTDPSTDPSNPPSTAPSTSPSTAPSTEPTTAASSEPSTAPSTQPTSAPSSAPSTAPTSAPSADASEAPISNPTATPSSTQSAAPTGQVQGIVGTPSVTPPPTDTMSTGAPAQANDGWRAVLVLVAAGLAGALVASRPRGLRRRA